MRAAAVLAVLTLCAPAAEAWTPTGEGALFFERGHYWIEIRLEIKGAAGDTTAPAGGSFEIRETGGGDPFHPSRVELLADGEGSYAILSSGRLRGTRCYLVDWLGGAGGTRTVGPLCDPAGPGPDEDPRREGFFARYLAPAFSMSGEEYRFTRLCVDYDFTPEKATAAIDIAPLFEAGPLRLTPFFSSEETTYRPGRETERRVSRRRAGAAVSVAGWTGPVRLSLEGQAAEERETYSSTSGESGELSTEARGIFRIRLDNLFDRINRHGISVFKGIDAGGGWAWYTEAGSPGLGRLDLSAPLLTARATWTLLAVLQLSYDIETCRPDGGNEWYAMHRGRIRLLLREALAPPEGRTYHPDLVLEIESGRRLPLLEREESVSLGFSFELYPW
ncbi:MAG: hypothetical protein PHQ19_07015 [Candidatus Krumholzibacteria bacterium]|nr:hypothetical protein [Candidatus Krumholzibacteria bacterium]